VSGILVRLWRGWKEIAGYIGDFQARLILTVFYFTVFVPFALIARLGRDPLLVRRRPSASGWLARTPAETDLPAARRQF
jgi:hypothetical protein